MLTKGHPSERREFGRRATHLHGRARIPGRPDLHCLLREISAGGARLQFADDIWVPFLFELVVESHGITVWCEVRHQRGRSVGVMFVSGKPGERAIVPAFDSAKLAAVDERRTVGQPDWPEAPEVRSTPNAGSSLRERVLKTYDK